MPAYNAAPISGVTAFFPGDMVPVWNAEAPAVGTASQQLAVGVRDNSPTGTLAALELEFSGNPGNFTIDVQEADTDKDGAYQKGIKTVTQALVVAGGDGKYYARAEFGPFRAKFIRLFMTIATSNAVNTTARLSQ